MLLIVVAMTALLPAALGIAISGLARAQSHISRLVLSAPPTVLTEQDLTASEIEFVKNNPVLRVAIAPDATSALQSVDGQRVDDNSAKFLLSVAKTAGFELKWQEYESEEASLLAIQSGEADVSPAALFTAERQEYLRFTHGVSSNPISLIGLTSTGVFDKSLQFSPIKVAVLPEQFSHRYLATHYPKATLVASDSVQHAVKSLEKGDVDFYIGRLPNKQLEQAHSLQVNTNLETSVEMKQRFYFRSNTNRIAVRSDWPLLISIIDKHMLNAQLTLSPEIAVALKSDTRRLNSIPPLEMTRDERLQLSSLGVLRVGLHSASQLVGGLGQNKTQIGVAAAVTAELAYTFGIPILLKNYPDGRAIMQAMQKGDIDIIPYIATRDRDNPRAPIVYSEPYLTLPWMLVGREAESDYWDLGSLAGKTLAIKPRHPLREYFAENYSEINLLRITGTTKPFEAVANGAADATVENKLNTYRQIADQYAGRLHVLGEVDAQAGRFAMAVAPRNEALMPIINKGISVLPEDFANSILRRWSVVDLQSSRDLERNLRILLPLLAIALLFLLTTIYWNRKISSESHRRLMAEQRLVDMTDQLHTGVFQFMYTPNQPINIEFTNTAARNMVHVNENNLLSHGFFSNVDREDRKPLLETFQQGLKTGQPFRETFRYHYPGGDKRWILVDTQCRTDDKGTQVWSGSLFDMTSERMLRDDLNQALQSRSEFMAMASHELRTPVQNVQWALNSLEEHELAPTSHAKLKSAKEGVTFLEELVNDIMDVSNLSNHIAPLRSDNLNVHEIIHDVCRTFDAAAKSKMLDYRIDIDESVPTQLLGDRLRIKQILYNLVGNAIKYTELGSVTVALSTGSKSGYESNHANDIARLQILVSDTGIGIPADQLTSIFEPFSTVGPPSLRSSGLGLTLCKRLLNAMGGTISVESVEYSGSHFTVTLPLKTAQFGNPISDDSLPRPFVSHRWIDDSETLLVVDDNVLVRDLMSNFLALEGWRVIQAESGEEALQLIKNTSCRAIITDQNMARMDGVELAQNIRKLFDDESPRPVLILMTGGLSRDKAECAEAVFDALLFKPIRANDISRAIREVTEAADAHE